MKYVAALVFGALVILAVVYVFSLPKAGNPCLTEGERKFHSTGKIVKCEGGRWVLHHGTPPQ